jgi:hypothetical protein
MHKKVRGTIAHRVGCWLNHLTAGHMTAWSSPKGEPEVNGRRNYGKAIEQDKDGRLKAHVREVLRAGEHGTAILRWLPIVESRQSP